MDSYYPTSESVVRQWRTATIVATAFAGLELLALVAIAVMVFGASMVRWAEQSTGAKASAAPSARQVQKKTTEPTVPAPPRQQPLAAPQLTRGDTSVLVLNGNGVNGAAAVEAQLVRAKGYLVTAVGDAPRADYSRSMVMYRPGFKPEGARLARDLRITLVSPLDGMRVKDLLGAHASVVIGAR